MADDVAAIRAWARDNGHQVSDHGRIPEPVRKAWEDAQALADLDPDNAGVTAADFYVGADDPPDAEVVEFPKSSGERSSGSPSTPAGTGGRERRPREVKGRPSARKRGWRQMWGAPKARPRGPRASLSEFAGDLWSDLAMITGGIPPVSRVLAIQAPYVGAAFDEAVKSVPFVDSLLQPVARYSMSLRALNGMFGPPAMVFSICARGESAWVHDDSGRLAVDADGWLVPTPQTAVQLGLLRYSLLQMTRTADTEAVARRAIAAAADMRAVDTLMAGIFGFPERADKTPGQGTTAPGDPAPVQPAAVFRYPPPPEMDDTGAMREPAQM